MMPCATLPISAAWMPVAVSVATPSSTKPMCPTLEYAMSRFSSVWARQTSEPTRMAATASTPSTGAAQRAPSGVTPTATRIRPYVPILSSTPASSTLPTVGAWVCASGSQECSGQSGLFTAKASASSVTAASWVPRDSPVPPVSATMSAVPAAATTTYTPTSSSTEPNRV